MLPLVAVDHTVVMMHLMCLTMVAVFILFRIYLILFIIERLTVETNCPSGTNNVF